MKEPVSELARRGVVGQLLEQALAEALGHAAVDLALDEHRVDHAPDVVHHRVADDRDRARVLVDLDLAHLAAVGKGHRRRRERRRLGEPGLQVRRKLARLVGGAGHRPRSATPRSVPPP